MAVSVNRRGFVLLAATIVGVVAAPILVGCADDSTATSTPASSRRYGPDAWRTMFGPIGSGQSEEFLQYRSLSEAVRDSRNVAVRVEAGRNVRVADDLGGETDAERWLVLAADLPLVRVLAGTAPVGPLEVQFASFDAPGPGDAEGVVAAMAKALVELGQAIWILQRSSTRPVHLRLATSQCLFVGRRGKVTDPMYPGGTSSDPVADEAMTYRTLDRLAAGIEAIAAT